VFICRADGTDEHLYKVIPIELGTVFYCPLRAISEDQPGVRKCAGHLRHLLELCDPQWNSKTCFCGLAVSPGRVNGNSSTIINWPPWPPAGELAAPSLVAV
jgi:hypothetical protein